MQESLRGFNDGKLLIEREGCIWIDFEVHKREEYEIKEYGWNLHIVEYFW